jgi:3-methyladenine DNA glycosylase AlkD
MVNTVRSSLQAVATPERAKANAWFFKTGPGQYGFGDKFLGVTVPQQRKVAKQFKDLPLIEAEKLIMSAWHEERLTGLFILVDKFQRADTTNKKLIYDFYISHTKNVNNWDLVDSSAPYIVGPWLNDKPNKTKVLTKLAKSNLLWDRRIAMLSTFYYINKCSRADEAIAIANILLYDTHDLIQKAVGWMLREIGKRVDKQILLNFLDEHAAAMPRTSLRYAIEHLTTEQRAKYMGKVVK